MKGTFFGVVFLIVGIAISVWGIQAVRRSHASRNWPTTEGTVVSSAIERSGRSVVQNHRAEIEYEYSVKGITHSSGAVSCGDYGSAFSSHAREIVERYPQGKKVPVYYDPQDPSVAVLEPGSSWGAYIPLLIGVLFCGVAAGGILRSILVGPPNAGAPEGDKGAARPRAARSGRVVRGAGRRRARGAGPVPMRGRRTRPKGGADSG